LNWIPPFKGREKSSTIPLRFLFPERRKSDLGPSSHFVKGEGKKKKPRSFVAFIVPWGRGGGGIKKEYEGDERLEG